MDGIPYIVAGLGGGGSYGFGEPLAESLVRVTNVHGYTMIVARQQSLSVSVMTTDGQVIDSFSIEK